MAFYKSLSEMWILLTTCFSVVYSQQTGAAPTDANTLFSNLLSTSNPGGQPPTSDPNSFSNFGTSGTVDIGAGAGMGPPVGMNTFPSGTSVGLPSRGMPINFPMPQFPGNGINGINAMPAPLPRPNLAQNLMPYMLMRGGDMGPMMAMMSMMGGAGGLGGGGLGGMMGNPFLMYNLMNNM